MLIRVVDFVSHPLQEVDGVEIRLSEMVWSDGKHTWEVFHPGSMRSISHPSDVLDRRPTDSEIIELLRSQVGWWICQGCRKTYRARERDMVRQHTDGCDLWQFYVKQERRR